MFSKHGTRLNAHGGVLFAIGVTVALCVTTILIVWRLPPGSPVLMPVLTMIHPFLRLPAPHNGGVLVLSVLFNGCYYLCAGVVFDRIARKQWSVVRTLFVTGGIVAAINLTLTVVFLICEYLVTRTLTTAELFRFAIACYS